MKKVYVAGKLNADAVGYIKNIYKMIKTAKVLRNQGFSVYVPGNDFLEGIVDGNFEYEDFFDNSQPWLLSSDAMFLTPGWETSSGTLKEIKLARENNIPVFYNIDGLKNYFDTGDTSLVVIGVTMDKEFAVPVTVKDLANIEIF